MATLDDGSAWVGGLWLEGGSMRAYARAWDGRRWLDPESPVANGESGLTAMARTPTGAVWAAGWQQSDRERRQPLIVQNKGRGWRDVAGAALPLGSAVLSDLAFRRGRDGWAVGYLVPEGSSRHELLMQHWDGTTWTRVPLPWAAERSGVLRSVSVDADADAVWVAGTWLPTGEQEAQAFVAGRSDDIWRVHDLPSGPGERSDMWTVSALDGGAVAAAETSSGMVVIATCEPLATATTEPDLGETQPPDDAQTTAQPRPALTARGAKRVAAGADFVLRDVAGRVGLNERLETYRGLSADFDGDGWADVLYSRHADPPALALGGPDGFEFVRDGVFSEVDRHGCAAADIDDDGRIDALCAVGRAKGRSLDRHDLVLAPAFDDTRILMDAGGAEDPFGRGRDVVFMHLDDDAFPELFITTAPDRTDGLPATNRFFRNEGGRFVAAPDVGLDHSTGGECALAADIDADGDDDLLQCVEFASDGREPGLRIHRNDDGVLRERSKRLGVRPIADIDVVVADIDGDGRPDLAQLSNDRLRVSRGTRTGFSVVFDGPLEDGVAIAAGDIDGDGRADLYVARSGRERNRKDRIYLSRPRADDGPFEVLELPRVAGKADDVFSLDHDRNGRADFLVLNGRGDNVGPVQLIASFPRGN